MTEIIIQFSEEKNQLFNNTNCIDENSIKNKIEKTIPKECVENINSESSTFEGDSFLPSLEKKEDAIFNQTKRFIQEHEIKKSEMKLNNKFNSTKTGFKKRGNDDRNNNSLLVKNIVVKPESSFIVLDDSPVKTKKSKIKKTKISQDFIKNKEQIHKKDQDINFESYDYCEETKQIQVPLQHGNIFNVYRHSPYKEFIENESVNKTRPNSRAD